MIRIGVVGLGHWGPNLARNFQNPPATEVTHLVDADRSRLDRLAQHYPQATLLQSTDALWDAPDVDAIVIATPTASHYAIAKSALLAGKHVLVEKPLAARSDHVAELIELARGAARVLMVGHVFVYNAAVRSVKKILDGEALGCVHYMAMERTNLGPIRTDVGAAWDLATHDISIANYWLGAPPLSVSAVGGSWLNPGIHDAVFATLRYQSGTLAHIHASWLHPRKTRDTSVVGDKGMLTFDDMNLAEPVRIYDKRVLASGSEGNGEALVDTFAKFREAIQVGDVSVPHIGHSEPLRAECDAFVHAVTTGQEPDANGLAGLAVVRVLEAIDASIAGGGCEVAVAG